MVDMPRNNNNTKEKIFIESTRLFSEKSYDVTSVRDIAKAAGVNEASIYHHYQNKADILDAILDEFRRRLKHYILSEKQIDRYIKTDTPDRLLHRCVQFFDDYEAEFMMRAYRIVCMQQMIQEKARDIVTNDLISNMEKSICYAINRLAELEKIPSFDAAHFSAIWAQMMYSGTILYLSNFSDSNNSEMSMEGIHAISDFMIEVAANGKIPVKKASNFF